MSDPIYWDDEIRDLGRKFWERLLIILADEPERVAYIKKVLKEFDTYEAVQDFKNAIGDATANKEGE